MILNRQPLHTSSKYILPSHSSATAITTPSSPTQLSAMALFESLNVPHLLTTAKRFFEQSNKAQCLHTTTHEKFVTASTGTGTL
jgi:hypothetical protein